MKEKRNIHELIVKEAPSLNNLLDAEDVSKFRELTSELRDTWTKKQVFRTETEMRMSVLQDAKYPTKASKYWQCVREQNVFLENLMNLSFECRRNEVKLKRLEQKLETEKDPIKRYIGKPIESGVTEAKLKEIRDHNVINGEAIGVEIKEIEDENISEYSQLKQHTKK